MHSLSTLLPFATREIRTAADEDTFVDLMAGLVQTHANTIPVLARGFLESRKYIHSDAVTRFLDEHLRARIGTRLIAEQHLALYYSSQESERSGSGQAQSSFVGIIDTALRPSKIIAACENYVSDICELSYGVRPSLVINGDPDARIAHVPVHLEYIITELLKNAFRATVEANNEREPVEVTIAPAPEEDEALSSNDAKGDSGVALAHQGELAPSNVSDVSSAGPIAEHTASTPGVTIRLRDRGGGISPTNYANLWNYGFTTFNEREAASSGGGSSSEALNVISGAGAGGGAAGNGGSSLAGLGYGLPLARAYAEYFGGGIAVQSLWSWGTDVYLTLRGVGRAR